MMYGSPSYQMGDEALVAAAATAPITTAQATQAKASLKKMRRSLRGWLKYRLVNDQIAAGNANAVPAPFLKRPRTITPPATVHALRMRRQRADDEADLAGQLHSLLSEVFDPQSLPDPDVTKNPNAAVDLAKIAIGGTLPGEVTTPGAQGFIWLWPLVIVVGAIAYVISTSITSSADVAKDKEQIACIEAGKCTDTGFWIKVGAVAVVGWIVWDKMGVGERVTGAFKKKRGR